MIIMVGGVIFLKTIKGSGEKGMEHDQSTVLEGLMGKPLWEGEVWTETRIEWNSKLYALGVVGGEANMLQTENS